MLLRKFDNWKNIDETRGLFFIAQRIDELTFAYSLDSYKTPAMSLQALLREALGLLREASNSDVSTSEKFLNSVAHILDEIEFRLKGNFIATSVSSLNLKNLLAKRHNNEKISEMERRIKIASAEVDDQSYFHEIVASIILESKNDTNKEKLNFLAKEFTSFLQSRGLSRNHIYKSAQDFFWGDIEINNVEQFREFCRIVYPHNHDFIVVFGIDDIFASIDKSVLRRSGVYIIKKEYYIKDKSNIIEGKMVVQSDLAVSESVVEGGLVEEESIESLEDTEDEFPGALSKHFDKFIEENGFNVLVASHVEATDYASAVSKANDKINNVYNMFRLFSHKDNISISKMALVEQACCEGDVRGLPVPDNAMHLIRDMRRAKASSVMKRFSDNIHIDIGVDRYKFNNIINIHGMSLSVASPDIQLVNMWTCLETITPMDHAASKINSVINQIMPMLLLGYYNRIVTNLFFDAWRWNRRKVINIIKNIETHDGLDIKDRFVLLLSENGKEDLRKDLFLACGDFSLLRNRLFQVSSILSDQRKAFDRLAVHEKLVRWQIHRIYRARNSIVHSGNSPDYVRYLVENAHDYFDQTLLFCLEISAWKRQYSTFISCFDYAGRQCDMYMSSLRVGSASSPVWRLPKSRDSSTVFDD